MQTYFRQILQQLCKGNAWTLKWISDDYVGVLETKQKRRLFVLSDLGLNSSTARAISRDKCATYAVLRESQVPVIEHKLLYHPSEHDFLPEIAEYFNQYNRHIVLKDNLGSGGEGVFEIRKLEDVPAALKQAVLRSDMAALCPFYDIKYEYRLIMLDHSPRLTYRKERGEDWRFNLYQGATSSTIDEKLLETVLLPMAMATTKALNIRFCSVDIIETRSGEFLVMEVNNTVFIEKYLQQHPDKYDKVKALYQEAVEKLLEK